MAHLYIFFGKMIPFGIVALLSAVAVLADYHIKLASASASPYKSPHFYAGASVYFLTSFGWVHVFRHLKLSYIGIVYSFSTALLLIILGVFVFNESLSRTEIIGIILGFISLCFLFQPSHGGAP